MNKAKLLEDQILPGSGLPYEGREQMTPGQRKMFDQVMSEYNKRADAKLHAHDRKFSIPAQLVEVLSIFDQVENAHLFKTPTPSEIVALIRAKNFDGETVETVVSISDLDIGATFHQDSASGLLKAALEWLNR